MIEIIPAILTDKLDELDSQLKQAKEFGASAVQIDFADGKFVESQTLLPEDLSSSPLVTDRLLTEAHLMTETPEGYLGELAELNFNRVAAHLSVLDDPNSFIKDTRAVGLEVGIAINPEVPLDEIEPYVNNLDFILFLTVIPGAQGHNFEEPVLEKIHLEYLHSLRKQHKYVTIEVDGGVKLDNLEAVAEVGAERIVVGSGIWQASNPAQAYQALVDKAKTIA